MRRGPVGYCVLAVLVACAGLAFVGGGAGGAAAATASGNVTLGAEVSSFMQASSVEAADDVEEGTFEAALNRTDDPEQRRALIEQRRQRLEERNRRLRAERASLGRTPDARNRSIATRVAVGATELEQAINDTEGAAVAAGVDVEGLAELRANASSLRGPEVAELARGLAGPPGGVPGAGPPADVPAVGGEGPPGNRTDRPGANRSGPPANGSPAPGPGGPGRSGGPPSDPGPDRPSDGPTAPPEDDDDGDDGDGTDDGDDPEAEGNEDSDDRNGRPDAGDGTAGGDRGGPDRGPDGVPGGGGPER